MIANEHADLDKAKESVYILQRGLLIDGICTKSIATVLKAQKNRGDTPTRNRAICISA